MHAITEIDTFNNANF